MLGLILWYLPCIRDKRGTVAEPQQRGYSIIVDRAASIISWLTIGGILLAVATQPRGVEGDINWVQTLDVHVGPALGVLHGLTPMVDAFCQYGLLPYLIFTSAFTLVPPSYAAAVLAADVANMLYVLVGLLTVSAVVKSRSLLVALAIYLAIFVVAKWGGIPAAGALRFLPPMLACWALSRQRGSTVSYPVVAALIVASFWSLEALIWTAGVVLAGEFGRLVYERAPVLAHIRTLAVLIAAVVLSQGIFALAIRGIDGRWPRYDIYLEILSVYAGAARSHLNFYDGQPLVGGGWVTPYFTTGPAWIAEALIYFAAITLGVAEIMRGRRHGEPQSILVTLVLPVTVAGVAGMSYWIGRAAEPNLWSTMVPAFLLAIVGLDHLASSMLRMRLLPFKVAAVTMTVVAVVGACVIVVSAWPTWASVAARRQAISAIRNAPSILVYSPIIQDAVALIELHQPPAEPVLLFVRSPRETAVDLFSRRTDYFGFTNSVEEFSSTLFKERMQRLAALQPGRLIFAESNIEDFATGRRKPSDDVTNLYPQFTIWAYAALRTEFDLCIIDRSASGVVAATIARKGTTCVKLNADR